MLEEELDESYREILDGVVNLHIELYEDRTYDMVGRRIHFSDDHKPVDVVLADFDKGEIRLKYIDTTDEASELRKEARDTFAEGLEGSEWASLPSATRRSSNSEQLYDAWLKGNIYAPERRRSAEEFLRKLTEYDPSEFADIEILEG